MALVSRRGVMGVAAVGAVSGCSGSGSGRSAGAAKPAPGTAERARAALDSLTLLGQYDAALAAHPQLAGRLTPLRAQVALHVTAFGGRAPAAAGSAAGTPGTPAGQGKPSTAPPGSTPPPGSSTASPSATSPSATSPAATSPASTSPSTASPAAPTPAAALAALAAAERTLADRRAAALLTVPGELARLMASVAAAGAAHVVLLSPGAHTA
ncbi:hypothetical protein K7862_17960 [Streptomyces sp. PLK6-54]|uniref:Lipoprotein n=2 Tax=Actinacidiphila acidipaludis TaxID=2873382 RepID=A0ABS7Q8P1_9ACTN|nr:hypothetical protein [Streptomyces acidipaludis]